jgi:hypothetical protein
MSDNTTNYDSYFDTSGTVSSILKPKKKEKKESYVDINIDIEKYIEDYRKTKVRKKTFRYVPKQD